MPEEKVTTNTVSGERERFEAWAKTIACPPNLEHWIPDPRVYVHNPAQIMWNAWQAARSHSQPDAPYGQLEIVDGCIVVSSIKNTTKLPDGVYNVVTAEPTLDGRGDAAEQGHGAEPPKLWDRIPETPPQELSFVGADAKSVQYAMYGGKYYTLNHAECVQRLLDLYAGRRAYCHLCGKYFEGSPEWHGLGECVEICSRCLSTEPEADGLKLCKPCGEVELLELEIKHLKSSDPARKLAEALRKYLSEMDSPVKDYVMTKYCRDELRAALASYSSSVEGKDK